MLRIDHGDDYKHRWPIAEAAGLIRAASLSGSSPSPLQDVNGDGLHDLSLVFFTGWLFTSILNRSKELIRLSLMPFGPNGESSLFVLYEPTTHLASPSRQVSELFDPEYFVCPLDRSGGAPLSETQRHLCPVVNKLRYNLAHARSDHSVDGLKEPDRTQFCCDSKKAKLWDYLDRTVQVEPEVYGPMVGGRCCPIRLPYSFLEKYLTGIEPTSGDLGKLLEETLLWFAMAESGVLMGFAHAKPKVPIEFNEIDILLYEAGAHTRGVVDPPAGSSWEDYLREHGVSLMELTVGHHAEVTKGAMPQQTSESGSGKDVPKNKLMNFHAMKSFGFRVTHGNYFTVIREASLADATARALSTTEGFTYRCLSNECGDDIGQLVLNYPDAPIPWNTIREWHERLIAMVIDAAKRFRDKL
jgi:hypothetical protein